MEYLGAYNITNYKDSNGAVHTAINHLDFCQQLNIFDNLIKYYKTRYLDNPILMKNYNYSDLYLDNIDKEVSFISTSIDI